MVLLEFNGKLINSDQILTVNVSKLDDNQSIISVKMDDGEIINSQLPTEMVGQITNIMSLAINKHVIGFEFGNDIIKVAEVATISKDGEKSIRVVLSSGQTLTNEYETTAIRDDKFEILKRITYSVTLQL